MRIKLTREFYIPKGAVVIKDKNSTAVAYLYATNKGEPVVKCFAGKRAKPDYHYKYKTMAAAHKKIADHAIETWAVEETKKASRAARSSADRGLDVGDVLRCSWGYDQTNIDYYQVLRLVGKKSVEIIAICADSKETGNMKGDSVPSVGEFKKDAKPMIKRATKGAVRIESYANAYKMEPAAIVAGAAVYKSSHWTAYA